MLDCDISKSVLQYVDLFFFTLFFIYIGKIMFIFMRECIADDDSVLFCLCYATCEPQTNLNIIKVMI